MGYARVLAIYGLSLRHSDARVGKQTTGSRDFSGGANGGTTDKTEFQQAPAADVCACTDVVLDAVQS